MSLEDYVEQNKEEFEVSSEEIDSDTWLIYRDNQGICVTHKEHREDLEGLKFRYTTFQQLKDELNSLAEVEESCETYIDKQPEGEPEHIMYDRSFEDGWIQSPLMYSPDSRR